MGILSGFLEQFDLSGLDDVKIDRGSSTITATRYLVRFNVFPRSVDMDVNPQDPNRRPIILEPEK